jgi:hypothetical protein
LEEGTEMIPFQLGLNIDELQSLSWSDVSPTSTLYTEVAQTAPVRYMWEEHPQFSSFLYYAGFGLFDPKMPAELRLFGPGYVAANVLGVGALLWTLDPEDKREGGFFQTEFWERMRPEFPWENPRYVWN